MYICIFIFIWIFIYIYICMHPPKMLIFHIGSEWLICPAGLRIIGLDAQVMILQSTRLSGSLA